MATLEERVSTLEEEFESDFRAPFEAVMSKVDELSRNMREHGREIREIKARLGVMDMRLNSLDEKMDSLREHMQGQDKKIDQILLMLTSLTNKPE